MLGESCHGVVDLDPNPSISRVFGVTEENMREDKVTSAYTSDVEGVLHSYDP